ncbi:hypothetical protein K450DRAFT_262671 [Umbelopsis ramanniana AG]|uniref:CHCH domain-containing protein n=1 Tax=Umbelopsis ramanniana AG TaxID=1314678 RepID=A0AAD5E064_UMBRA|nr:uncharacterized protein K450DRAFT_262671 [Umbelopsis ramanniana AG]KAI8575256.1 hypothetical protein K450DRAFT_262671 [Umbelopsis ramanniana AG]
MPRQTRRSAPARAPAPQTQQTRQAHTAPVRQQPVQHQAPPAPQQHAMTPAAPAPSAIAHPAPQQPGLFAQMATTAAGVAVGSAAGHAITAGVSSMFGGGGSEEPQQPQQQQQQYQQPPQQVFQQQPTGAASCEADAQAFTKCLQTSNNDVTACQWYLDSLKACQQMAANY